jgi:leucine-zipper of insertion element IS481
VTHANAPLTATGRLRLARCVVENRWPLRRAAERFQVSVSTAARRAGRYRDLGETGMADRSSRPHASPNRTPARTERRIIKVRVLRRWGPARIAYLLGLNPSTVYRVLTRYRLARLVHLDRATGWPVRRYEHTAPGDLVHVDIKKLGNIPDGGGHRMHGRAAGGRNSSAHRDPARPRQVHGRPNLGYSEWAYARPYRTETERRQTLPGWLHTYDHYRGHTALNGQPPTSRVPNLTGHYT